MTYGNEKKFAPSDGDNEPDRDALLPRGNGNSDAVVRSSERHPLPLSSVPKTFGNIVVSIVGSAVLGMPHTFKKSGWLCGALSLSLVGLACYYTMLLLVLSKRKLENMQGHEQEQDQEQHRGSDTDTDTVDDVQSYSDLGYVAFGNYGRVAVDLVIILSQGAFCVAYLIFIGENLANMFTTDDAHDDHGQDPPGGVSERLSGKGMTHSAIFGLHWHTKAIYVWILFPLQVWLASIRSLTVLAPFSLCADAANMIAMAVVMSYDVAQIAREGAGRVNAFTGWRSLPYMIGVGVYAYEGFGLVLPIESSMKDRSKFGPTMAIAMGFITVLYTAFGALGYFAFGEATRDIITLNIGGSWYTYAIKLALCLGLTFTFPVMMHPVHEVLERRCKDGRPSFVIRTVTVLAVAWTAVAVPHFGDFLSLIGSSVCCVLSFVLPALFHLRIFSGGLCWWQHVLDYAFIVFGVVMGIWGTWSSLENW